MAAWEVLTRHVCGVPHALHQRLRARHARRHPVAAPANVAHQESLSLLDHAALLVTDAVGTTWCVLVFLALSCVSLPAVIAAGSVILWISWITQTCLQLVLLPLIMVGQNLQARHGELRAEADHELGQQTAQTVAAILAAVKVPDRTRTARTTPLRTLTAATHATNPPPVKKAGKH